MGWLVQIREYEALGDAEADAQYDFTRLQSQDVRENILVLPRNDSTKKSLTSCRSNTKPGQNPPKVQARQTVSGLWAGRGTEYGLSDGLSCLLANPAKKA